MLLQPILIAIKESGQRWQYRGTENKLDETYTYHAPDIAPDFYVHVRSGFLCDGASSPRFLWSMTGFLPRGIHDPAALVHDKLYEDKGMHYGQEYTRKDADKLFYKMLVECGIKSWHAKGAYFAVRVGGGLYWKKK